jgi:translation initiation factor 1
MIDISQMFNGRNLEEDDFRDLKKSKKQISSTEFIAPEKHFLHFRKEKRRGKTITMVGFFQISDSDKKELLKSIKKSVSTGGTVRDEYLEFQGDIQERLRVEFLKRGFRFK